MKFNVEVYLDEINVKTYYNVPGEDEASAIEYVQENLMGLDFSAEQND